MSCVHSAVNKQRATGICNTPNSNAPVSFSMKHLLTVKNNCCGSVTGGTI